LAEVFSTLTKRVNFRYPKRWRSGLAGSNEWVGGGGGIFWRWFTRADRAGRLELGGLFGINLSQGAQEGVAVVAVRGCGQGVYEIGHGGLGAFLQLREDVEGIAAGLAVAFVKALEQDGNNNLRVPPQLTDRSGSV
jgi:hypothetical protein